jgi:hypothetical protein
VKAHWPGCFSIPADVRLDATVTFPLRVQEPEFIRHYGWQDRSWLLPADKESQGDSGSRTLLSIRTLEHQLGSGSEGC